MNESHWTEVLSAIVSGTKTAKMPKPSQASKSLSFPKLTSWEKGKAEAVWKIKNDYLNSNGQLFGGYYSILADIALAYAVMTVLQDNEFMKTVDLRVLYFRPASTGSIHIESQVINRSRSLVYTEAVFLNVDRKKLSKATGTFAVVSSN